ncbi:MAG: AbrB/MazE/SpoVT family DNA-binding domain-containing protein [bacterium]
MPPKSALIKRLSKHGNSRSVVIDKPILELLGIDDDTPLLITTEGEKLILTPMRSGAVDAEGFDGPVRPGCANYDIYTV